MKITTLIENLVYQKKLVAEHGLSFLVEDDKKILFDTGQTSQFIKNAKELGIDIRDVDAVVISHGHYDHTGGLKEFLRINNKAKIYIKRSAFVKKYSKGRYVGIPKNLDIPEDRLEFVTSPLKISSNIIIVPQIKTYFSADQHKESFTIKEDGIFFCDEFSDELFLMIDQEDSISIISSCSHNGITNIIETAKNIDNKILKMVLGGFHTKNDKDNSTIDHIISYLNKNQTEDVYVCHCTGIEKFAEFHHKLNGNVKYNHTGKIINL